MTPQEFEKLAIWMGWEFCPQPDGTEEWWGKDAKGLDEFKGRVDLKTSLTDAECIESLNRLVEKGYVNSELSYHNLNWWMKIQMVGYNSPVYFAICPTINAAIETVLLKMIAAENP